MTKTHRPLQRVTCWQDEGANLWIKHRRLIPMKSVERRQQSLLVAMTHFLPCSCTTGTWIKDVLQERRVSYSTTPIGRNFSGVVTFCEAVVSVRWISAKENETHDGSCSIKFYCNALQHELEFYGKVNSSLLMWEAVGVVSSLNPDFSFGIVAESYLAFKGGSRMRGTQNKIHPCWGRGLFSIHFNQGYTTVAMLNPGCTEYVSLSWLLLSWSLFPAPVAPSQRRACMVTDSGKSNLGIAWFSPKKDDWQSRSQHGALLRWIYSCSRTRASLILYTNTFKFSPSFACAKLCAVLAGCEWIGCGNNNLLHSVYDVN